MSITTDFVILCGGQGTRLRSIVGDSQKVLVPVGKEPFLDLLIKYIRAQGGRRVILATGYKADDVQAHCRDLFKDMDIDFSRENEPLGTGGALKQAWQKVRTDNFFVLNGDSFCPVEFETMLDLHIAYQSHATVALAKVDDSQDYGSVILDDAGCVTAFQEKVPSGNLTYLNAGIYCFRNDFKNELPDVNKFSLERDFFPSIIGKGFCGYVTDQSFHDIGTPQRLNEAVEKIKKLWP
ncbi:MAG: nucleotidyltransferase family protein [Candidatus Omnitrophica bacterium]|nr:nucleotidyltransferase family protein [Candidatus Omnitrophota bacterium]